MARVNHKLVKQRLNEKRSKITDKQFFSSRMLAGHFEDLAAAQTRRYHYNRRVRVNLYWKPKDAFTAATDNMQIRINTGHPLVTKVKGRENRYQLVCGMFAHELGHVLFTDFLSAQTYHNYLDSFKWYPRPPAFQLAADARNEKAFWEYVKEDPKNLQMVHQIAANIANILHEYVMIVRKDSPVLIPILMTQSSTVDIRDMPGATWRDVIAAVLETCKEPVALSFLYEQIEPHKKAQSNKWWKEKIRQTLQINPMHFTHDGRGLWSLNRNAA